MESPRTVLHAVVVFHVVAVVYVVRLYLSLYQTLLLQLRPALGVDNVYI